MVAVLRQTGSSSIASTAVQVVEARKQQEATHTPPSQKTAPKTAAPKAATKTKSTTVLLVEKEMKCQKGHYVSVEGSMRVSKRCDMCGGRNCKWRCTAMCDYDICVDCKDKHDAKWESTPISKRVTSAATGEDEDYYSEWQSYVDELIGKGHTRDACILSYPDGEVIAKSGSFEPQDYHEDYTVDTCDDAGNEIQIAVSEINGIIEYADSNWESPPAGGLRINKIKYTWLSTGEYDSSDYKMEIKYARVKCGGLACMVYSETTILIAVAAEVIGFHQCVKDTCELAAYFKSTGY